MTDQLKIHFPLFSPEIFGKVKEEYVKLEKDKKEKEIEHLKHVISGYKGWKTKRTKGGNDKTGGKNKLVA
jgi:hypothetical protein